MERRCVLYQFICTQVYHTEISWLQQPVRQWIHETRAITSIPGSQPYVHQISWGTHSSQPPPQAAPPNPFMHSPAPSGPTPIPPTNSKKKKKRKTKGQQAQPMPMVIQTMVAVAPSTNVLHPNQFHPAPPAPHPQPLRRPSLRPNQSLSSLLMTIHRNRSWH